MEIDKNIYLGINICDIHLQNPVIAASGCFGFGYEMNQFYPVDILGSISIKGTTLNPRFGNQLPRVAECSSGMLNSVGLQNPGIDNVIAKRLPKLREVFHQPIIANISGFSIEEYVECCEKITQQPQIGFIELNVSCPNVHGGGIAFGTDKEVLGNLVKEVKKVSTIPLFVKLSPNVTDIVEMVKSVVDNGADGVVLINTLLGMRLDIKTGQPILANVTGGLSGPSIFPVALRMVYQVRKAFPDLPIFGCGGVSSAEDVIEMLMAGADAVEVGTANLINPYACEDIIYDLPTVMRGLNLHSLGKLYAGGGHEEINNPE